MMRPLQSILESYTEPNSYLLRHLKNDDFDPYAVWWHVCMWIEENDYLPLISAAAGEPITFAGALHDHEADLFYKLPEEAQKKCAEDVINYMMQHDPAEAPTNSHLSVNGDRLLPRGTWLIHFSDDAGSISYKGFTHGIADPDKLGLTTYYSKNAKKYGGYNFAFEANSRHASWAASQRKYGDDAVMFQNSGVDVTHYGDEEDQVIFWGKDVDPRRIIYLHRDSNGEWNVMAKGQAKREVLVTGTFDKIVNWVIQNEAQYRNVLYGR